jgi:hypothetical protein
MKRLLILTPILLAALLVRTFRLYQPLADWHSWRQADTAAVTRRYVAEGIDLLRPRYDDLSNIPSGQDNPQGYRMVEFPLVNALTAWLYQTIPGVNDLDIHVFCRLVSITFSLASLIFLYLLVEKLSSQLEATLAALVFALLPYNIFYSRTILPEVPLVFFSLAAMYLLVKRILDKKSIWSWEFWFSAVLAALSLLLKPYAIFLALPLFYFGFRHHGWKLFKQPDIYVYLILAITPLLLWRLWIRQFPEGIPAFIWLLNGNKIRFKGAFFRWIFADRFGRLILGYFGLIPIALGLIKKPFKKTGWFYHWWLLAILAYITVFATGNVQHDYYQIITVPIISIFVARGLTFLLNPPAGIVKSVSYLLLVTSCLFMLAFGWFHIRDFFNINHPEIVSAGKLADQILPPDAKVIAPYQGDTAFLYQTNRQGWPIGGNIANRIKQGATHYVSVNFDQETKSLINPINLPLSN